jgi:thymidine phosphorylase
MVDNFLYLTKIGIDTHQQAVVFMRKDCHVCRAEGFNAMTRVRVYTDKKSITATLITVSEKFLSHDQAGLSDVAWQVLGAEEGEIVQFSHAPAVDSMSMFAVSFMGRCSPIKARRPSLRTLKRVIIAMCN